MPSFLFYCFIVLWAHQTLDAPIMPLFHLPIIGSIRHTPIDCIIHLSHDIITPLLSLVIFLTTYPPYCSIFIISLTILQIVPTLPYFYCSLSQSFPMDA